MWVTLPPSFHGLFIKATATCSIWLLYADLNYLLLCRMFYRIEIFFFFHIYYFLSRICHLRISVVTLRFPNPRQTYPTQMVPMSQHVLYCGRK